MKKEKKIDTKKVLQEKSRSKKELREECKKRGIPQATFYYQFNTLKSNNEIIYLFDEKVYQLVERDLADTKEIRLYIDYIKNPNIKLREVGINELTHLCASRVVTHDSSLIQFFEKAFTDASYHDIHAKLLEAFRCVLGRCLGEEQEEMKTRLLEQNKTALLNFIQMGSLSLQKTALSTLTLRSTRETLEYLLELIERKSSDEYQYLRGVILKGLRSYLEKYKLDIKTKLFEIATTNTHAEIKDRAIDLLGELSATE
jgi:hypothetical protein